MKSFSTDFGDFEYEVTSGGASGSIVITGFHKTTDEGSVVIPDKIEGLPVTVIGDRALADNQLTHIDIPPSVAAIGEFAFIDNKLTSVIISEGVKSIGYAAFADNQLTHIDIPSSVTVIGNWAFSGNHLTSAVLPSSIDSIGGYVFAFNDLTSVDIPLNISSIGEGAFFDNKLTRVSIGANVALENREDPVIDNGFDDFYNANGKKAGTYTYNGKKWTYKETNRW